MKKRILIIILMGSLILNAKIIKQHIFFNEDYFTLTNNYNSDYIYNFESGLPVLPAKKIFLEFRNFNIDSFEFIPIKIDTTKNFNPIIGENPILKIQKMNSKSRISKINSIFPSSLYNLEIGTKGKNSILYGKINNFRYYNNTLFSTREGVLNVYLTEKNINIKPIITPSILIITLDSLKPYWDEYQKIYPNFHCIIKSNNDILTYYPSLSIEQGLRTYIKDLYADSNLIATLIALDTDKIPGLYLYMIITPQLDSAQQLLITDKYYSCLDGDWNYDNDSIIGEMEDSIDIFPDILLARSPLNNSNEINNFINKIKSIRSFTGDTILFVSSFLDNNTDGSYATDNVIKLVGIEEPIKKLYEKDNNLSSTSFLQSINNSPFAILHVGHGSSTSIQSGTDYTIRENLDTLMNTTPPLLYSVSCWSAAYDYDCIAEHFLLSSGGGFYIGNSRYGWYTPYFPGFGTGDLYALTFFDYFYNSTYNPAQVLNNVFSDFAYQINHYNDYRWQFLCLTYFGDPLVNLKRNINSIDINFEKIVKNHFLNFTVPVEDSLIVYIQTNYDSFTQLLTYNNNLFSCAIDSSESIYVSIYSYSNIDTSFYIYPIDDSISCNLTNYSFDIDNDTLVLHANINVFSPGDYTIKVNGIADTLNSINNDTIFYLLNDTILDFKFLILNEISNNSFISIQIDNYNINLQSGFYFNNNIEYSLIPNKIHYNTNDTIQLNLSLENTGFETYYNISIILEKDNGINIDTIILPQLNAKQKLDTFSIFIADTSSEKLNIHSIIKNEYCEKTFTNSISLNNDHVFFDFENGSNFTIDSQTAYFHLSNNEALSGSLSFYCGFSTIDSYPSSYITTLYSDYFYYDTTCYIGFASKYNVEAGFDYCIVYIEQDTNKIPIATFDGISNNWEEYVFSAKKYGQDNVPSRLVFSFYSETDDIQYNGWYIDNVLLPTNSLYSHISNKIKNKSILLKTSITKNIVEFILPDNEIYNYKIYNITGQCIDNGILNRINNKINIKQAGKFFIKINEKFYTVTILK